MARRIKATTRWYLRIRQQRAPVHQARHPAAQVPVHQAHHPASQVLVHRAHRRAAQVLAPKRLVRS